MAIVNLSILVEDIGDGDLAPFITSEETLMQAQEQVPDAVILHRMTLADNEGYVPGIGEEKQLASTFDALKTLSNFMHGCEIEDLLMRFFHEGMKAGMQYTEKKVGKAKVVPASGLQRPAQSLSLGLMTR